MLRHAFILVLIYLSLVAQSSLIPMTSGIGTPCLPAVVLVLIAAWSHPALAILLSAVLGLGLDALSVERLGVQMILAAILSLEVQLCRPIWRSCSTLSLMALTLLITMAWRTLLPMSLAILSGRVIDAYPIAILASRDAVLTAVVAFVLILVGRFLTGSGSPRPVVVARRGLRPRLIGR